MKRTVSTMELRQRLGEILDRVALRHDQFIIERKGKALAAVVPIETLEQIRRAARLHLLDTLEGLAEGPQTMRQAAADKLADEAKHATRTREPRRRST